MFHDDYDMFNPFGCKVCEDSVPFIKMRPSGLCDDCEFDSLTPEAWPELLLAAMERWKKDKAS